MHAMIRICTGQASALHRAVWSRQGPPHQNDKLVAELRGLPDMDWVRRNYGEPCLDIASHSGQFQPIRQCFEDNGYSLAEA